MIKKYICLILMIVSPLLCKSQIAFDSYFIKHIEKKLFLETFNKKVLLEDSIDLVVYLKAKSIPMVQSFSNALYIDRKEFYFKVKDTLFLNLKNIDYTINWTQIHDYTDLMEKVDISIQGSVNQKFILIWIPDSSWKTACFFRRDYITFNMYYINIGNHKFEIFKEIPMTIKFDRLLVPKD